MAKRTTADNKNKKAIRNHFNGSSASPNTIIDVHKNNFRRVTNDLIEEIKNAPRLIVFSGSKPGIENIFLDQAPKLGEMLGETNSVYIYGNGNMGTMGGIASSFIQHRNRLKKLELPAHHIVGVTLDRFSSIEENLPGVNVYNTSNLYLRKKFFNKIGDGIVSFPGGIGTIDEAIEFITQDAYLFKTDFPCILINLKGISKRKGEIGAYDSLIDTIQDSVDMEMSKAEYFKNVFVADTIPEAIAIALKTMPKLKWHGSADAIPDIHLKDKLAIKLDLVDAEIRNKIYENLEKKEQAHIEKQKAEPIP